MLSIDGSEGEGGGQVLRTAVALSAVTGQAVRVYNIRAKRSNPGIMPQHLSAVKAVADLCGAELKGASAGSGEIEFIPHEIRGGKLDIDVGTAGSVTLVLQALMIPAAFAPETVRIRVRGGTDVRWSPSIDYLRYVTLPVLGKLGYQADIKLLARGYYPAGGGKVAAEIHPVKELSSLNLTERGRIVSAGGMSHAHRDLEKRRVAERQAKAARTIVYNRLANLGYSGDVDVMHEYVDALSYGSGITLWVETEKSVLGSDSPGAQGISSESVGADAANRLVQEIDSCAPLDRYMADQIVPYLALAGGSVSVSEVTGHTETNVNLLKAFGFDVSIQGKNITAQKPPN